MSTYEVDDQGFHGTTADTVFVVNCSGSDGPWRRMEWTAVEDDIHELCETTVDECEQEIHDGGRFEDDVEREEFVEDLYCEVMGNVLAGLEEFDPRWETHRRCHVRVAPWYAVEQRCTFTIDITVSDIDIEYGLRQEAT